MALILASNSAIRRQMLEDAGVEHRVIAAGVDEDAIKSRTSDPETVAQELAKAKALAVAATQWDDWVIGSDSVVRVDGRLFDKPTSRDEARDHLRRFSGKAMELTSAVALARGDRVDWCHCERATLKVRELSDDFIAGYLEREWPAVAGCVGVFRMEGPGVQLFEALDGSHFTILGMPLLPLLGALRARGLIPQ